MSNHFFHKMGVLDVIRTQHVPLKCAPACPLSGAPLFDRSGLACGAQAPPCHWRPGAAPRRESACWREMFGERGVISSPMGVWVRAAPARRTPHRAPLHRSTAPPTDPPRPPQLSEEEWLQYPPTYLAKIPSILKANPKEKYPKGGVWVSVSVSHPCPGRARTPSGGALSSRWDLQPLCERARAGGGSAMVISLAAAVGSRPAGEVPKLKPKFEIRRRLMPLVPFWCLTKGHTTDHACYGRLACGPAAAALAAFPGAGSMRL